MAYVAVLDHNAPTIGSPRKLWSPDLFSTVDGTYKIDNSGGKPVHYPYPFSYYVSSNLTTIAGNIIWSGSGTVVEPKWYSASLTIDSGFSATLATFFTNSVHIDPINWNSLILTAIQACTVTLTGSLAFVANSASPWIMAWQHANHSRGTALIKSAGGGKAAAANGPVSIQGTISETFLLAVGDTLELYAAAEPYGGTSIPTTTVSDFHGTFNLTMAPISADTGIISATCANETGSSSGHNPEIIISYNVNAFDIPVTTDSAGLTPLLVNGAPLILHITPETAFTIACPIGNYYLHPPLTAPGYRVTGTVYTNPPNDYDESTNGTFSIAPRPRPMPISVTSGATTTAAFAASGFS